MDDVTTTVAGWDVGWATLAAQATAALHALRERGVELAPARVSRTDRGAGDVLLVTTAIGSARTLRVSWGADVLAAIAQDPQAVPTTGDWALVATWPDGRRTLERVLPRRTAVVRSQVGGQSTGQVLAANADVVCVVEPLVPEPDLGRIARALSIAWASGGEPLVVLTKADLASDAGAVAVDVGGSAPGVAVLTVSAADGQGLGPLTERLAGGATLALVGASGAGKSTLLNALVGHEVMHTHGLRGDLKGRHTTATRELHLVGGGAVLDTPGLRSVGLDTGEGLRRAFADVVDLAATCRFRDCRHAGEPGCAVEAAVADGEMDGVRLVQWRKLEREAEWQEARTDSRLRAQRARRWKQIARQNRTARPDR